MTMANLSLRTKLMIWGRAAALCSLPTCRMSLVVDETEIDDAALIGEICHVVAEAENGPRGKSALTLEERNQYGNLLLLCRNHHKEIDDQEVTYTVAKLQQIKTDHEIWVKKSLPGYDVRKQRDDEIYGDYVDYWARASLLDEWADWADYVVSGEPRLYVEVEKSLAELGRWLAVRVWPGRYSKVEIAFENFRSVLCDFLDTFHKYSFRYEINSKLYYIKKFYKIPYWDEVEYHRLGKLYDNHIQMITTRVFDLTRAANLICDEIRTVISPLYRIKEGHIALHSSPHDATVLQYSEDQKVNILSYTGIAAFKEAQSVSNIRRDDDDI